MDEGKQKKIISFLTEKWGAAGCPLCGDKSWSVLGEVFELREFRGGNLTLGAPVVPVIPVACQNCGNTVLVSAVKAGVVVPDAKKDTEKPHEG